MVITSHIELRDNVGYIIGRAVKAKMVARMHLWDGSSIPEVAEHYQISLADVHAAIAFYYDNQSELDNQYAENMQLLAQVGRTVADYQPELGLNTP